MQKTTLLAAMAMSVLAFSPVLADDNAAPAKKGGPVKATENMGKKAAKGTETLGKDAVKGTETVTKDAIKAPEVIGKDTMKGMEKMGKGAEHMMGVGKKKAPATTTK